MSISSSSLKVSEIISPEKNNLDLFRLVAACLVIYGHASTIAPSAGHVDYFHYIIGTDSSALAVYIFFFLSGLLVTNSLLTKKNIINFLIARFFRIFPGLFATILLTTLFCGLFITRLDLSDFFLSPVTKSYLANNLMLKPQYFLPGVFEGNPYKAVVNGSLWSIPYEVKAYFTVLILFATHLLSKRFALIMGLFVVLTAVLPNTLVIMDKGSPTYLTLDFSLGVLAALWKEEIRISFLSSFGLMLGFFVLKETEVAHLVLHLATFSCVIWVSYQTWFIKLKPSCDISYGVYLWGFPIAQLLVEKFPQQSTMKNAFLSILISLIFGFVSNKIVEKPSIKAGQFIQKKVNYWLSHRFR